MHSSSTLTAVLLFLPCRPVEWGIPVITGKGPLTASWDFEALLPLDTDLKNKAIQSWAVDLRDCAVQTCKMYAWTKYCSHRHSLNMLNFLPPALQTCDSFPQKCLIVHPPCHFDGSLVWLATLPHCFSWFRAGARQSGKQSLALRWGYRQDAFHARCHMVPGHALGTIGKEKSSWSCQWALVAGDPVGGLDHISEAEAMF